MTVADRWEGQPAGTCGCGSGLIWTREGDEWVVTHNDPSQAVYCSRTGVDVHTPDEAQRT